MSPRVVLVGPMGAGKTTVAGMLGDAWDLPVRDTDADIEATTGREISDIFVESGEDHFRDLEAAAVAAALAEHDGVLALGGGAVLRPETRELLAGLPVVFLRVGLSDAVKRVGLGVGRPLLLLPGLALRHPSSLRTSAATSSAVRPSVSTTWADTDS